MLANFMEHRQYIVCIELFFFQQKRNDEVQLFSMNYKYTEHYRFDVPDKNKMKFT
jgi:hypothetical protein